MNAENLVSFLEQNWDAIRQSLGADWDRFLTEYCGIVKKIPRQPSREQLEQAIRTINELLTGYLLASKRRQERLFPSNLTDPVHIAFHDESVSSWLRRSSSLSREGIAFHDESVSSSRFGHFSARDILSEREQLRQIRNRLLRLANIEGTIDEGNTAEEMKARWWLRGWGRLLERFRRR